MIFAFEKGSYLGEFEAEFKKPRSPGGIVWWKKTEGQKSCDTVPLKITV
jgi:hypothetical protein